MHLIHPTIGEGYSVGFGEHLLVFPGAECAPHESYFSAGYEA